MKSDHNDTQSQRYVGIIALVALIMMWGTVPVLLRGLTESVDVWTANGIRYPFSAMLFWPYLFFAARRGFSAAGGGFFASRGGQSTDGPPTRQLTWPVVRACVVPAFFSTGGQVFWGMSFYYLQASQVGFLVRATTIVVIVGSVVLFADERKLLRRVRFDVGVLLALAGFVSLSLTGDSAFESANVQGLLIMLCCSLLFGAYVVSVRKCIPQVHPTLAFAVVCQMCAAVVGTLVFAFGDYEVIWDLSGRQWIMLVTSSILGIGLGHIMLYTAIVRLGASVTTTCQSAMPFVTAAIASFALGETLTTWQWAFGGVIVIGALVLLSIKLQISATTPKPN